MKFCKKCNNKSLNKDIQFCEECLIKKKDIEINRLLIEIEIYRCINNWQERQTKLINKDVGKDYYDIPIKEASNNILKIFYERD